MPILKCKMCGGTLDVQEGMTVCECEYCGSKQTIPMLDNEKKTNLFNRANRLRFNNEFDKAGVIYESIVSEFPEEAEAYWGLLLCKYGIEYVDDPATSKKIPTCHRANYTSIFDDENFELCLECSDSLSKEVYRSEAKEIDRIQKSILDVASKEDPFDVFICYKETDENGDRTKDSVLAQDIYDKLTEKGYKVFFSRITLEDKLGQEYEPYIFSALNSAKVMLAIGTKFEYYDSVWVKNEWSRFLDLMKSNKDKVLIPCYVDIDAYDMPKEFKNLQGQDMNKLGFIQDLTRGVEKIVKIDTNINNKSNTIDIETLNKRSFLLIENNEYDKSQIIVDQILNINPEYANAYVAQLLIDYKLRRIDDLNTLHTSISDNQNFINACKFGNEELKKELNSAVESIKLNITDDMNKKRDELLKKKKARKKFISIFATLILICVLGMSGLFCFDDRYNLYFKARIIMTDNNDKMNAFLKAGVLDSQEQAVETFVKKIEEVYNQKKYKSAFDTFYKESSKFKKYIDIYSDKCTIKNENIYGIIEKVCLEISKDGSFFDWAQLDDYLKFSKGLKKEAYDVILQNVNGYVEDKLSKDGKNMVSQNYTLVYRCSRIYEITNDSKAKSNLLLSYHWYLNSGDYESQSGYWNLYSDEINKLGIKTYGDFYAELKKVTNEKTILENQLYDCIRLVGYWSNGNKYFSMDENGNTNYNLPWFSYGDYYYMKDHEYRLYYDGKKEESRLMYTFTFSGDNTIHVKCEKDNSYYTLTRN